MNFWLIVLFGIIFIRILNQRIETFTNPVQQVILPSIQSPNQLPSNVKNQNITITVKPIQIQIQTQHQAQHQAQTPVKSQTHSQVQQRSLPSI